MPTCGMGTSSSARPGPAFVFTSARMRLPPVRSCAAIIRLCEAGRQSRRGGSPEGPSSRSDRQVPAPVWGGESRPSRHNGADDAGNSAL